MKLKQITTNNDYLWETKILLVFQFHTSLTKLILGPFKFSSYPQIFQLLIFSCNREVGKDQLCDKNLKPLLMVYSNFKFPEFVAFH